MVRINQNTSIQGTITVKTEAGEVNIGYVSANVPKAANDFVINKNIQNTTLFVENREEVLKDIAEFEKYVYSLVDTNA